MNGGISHGIKRGLRSLLEHPSFNLVRRIYSGLGSSLLYHRVTSDAAGSLAQPTIGLNNGFHPNEGLSVSAQNFAEQMAFLSENYNCLDLATAIKLLREGQLPRQSVVVTFDDGYRDNLTVALPILERHGIPATVFITTGLIDRRTSLWWYELESILRRVKSLSFPWRNKEYSYDLGTTELKRAAASQIFMLLRGLDPERQNELFSLMRRHADEPFSYDQELLTWEEVERLDRHPLITIGAHTRTHPVLSQLQPPQLEDELLGAKKTLEDRLNHPIEHLAYPFGSSREVGPREMEATKRAAYKCAFTTRFGHLTTGHRNDLYNLPRIAIGCDDTLAHFEWKLSGVDSMLLHLGRRFVTSNAR
jgi:peptidoglycan/xylan/chitin deacetylase (PgdA/CDA1 family)